MAQFVSLASVSVALWLKWQLKLRMAVCIAVIMATALFGVQGNDNSRHIQH
jgi:hypothetical protein